MLGMRLAHAWRDRYTVLTTARACPPELAGMPFMPFDLTEPSLAPLVEWARADVIVHTAALTKVDQCECQPDLAMRVNASPVGRLLSVAPAVRLVHISTDAVFGRGHHLATEADPVGPLTAYGRSKLAAEEALLAASGPHCAVRTTIVGRSARPGQSSFAEWIFDSLRGGKGIGLFRDVLFTPIATGDLADRLAWVVDCPEPPRVLHIAGSEVSKYDFGRRFAARVGLQTDLIKAISLTDAGLTATRSNDQTLSSQCFQTISGWAPPSVDATVDSLSRYFEGT